MKNFKKFIKKLNLINWQDKNLAHIEVENLLAELKSKGFSYEEDIEPFVTKESRNLEKLSVETSTHFKWFLYENRKSDYTLWLHVYKPANIRQIGYAVVPHSHRYWFSSFIIKGGFKNSIYKIKGRKENFFAERVLADEKSFEEGKIYTLGSDVIHSIDDIKEPTFTLIIQSKALKNFSESFNFSTKRIQKHYSPQVERLNEMMKSPDFSKIFG